jgi:hypothetical protein
MISQMMTGQAIGLDQKVMKSVILTEMVEAAMILLVFLLLGVWSLGVVGMMMSLVVFR